MWETAKHISNVLTAQAYATVGEGPKWAGLDAATIAARVAAQVTSDSASIHSAGSLSVMAASSARSLPEDKRVDNWLSSSAVWEACSDHTTWLGVVTCEGTSCMAAGYTAVSVLSSRGRLTPLRVGFTWDAVAERYVLDPLLRAVEPPTAALLELPKLATAATIYFPSRNRQTHLYAVNERANAHSIALKRLFLR